MLQHVGSITFVCRTFRALTAKRWKLLQGFREGGGRDDFVLLTSNGTSWGLGEFILFSSDSAVDPASVFGMVLLSCRVFEGFIFGEDATLRSLQSPRLFAAPAWRGALGFRLVAGYSVFFSSLKFRYLGSLVFSRSRFAFLRQPSCVRDKSHVFMIGVCSWDVHMSSHLTWLTRPHSASFAGCSARSLCT